MRISTASLVALKQLPASRVLKASGFRRLWIGSVVEAFSFWLERLAIGWLVLDVTGSVFLAALSFAVQNASAVVIGPVAGALADRFERKRLLAVASASKSAIMVAIGVVVIGGSDSILPVFLLTALSSSARVFSIPATQALITDMVGARDSANAIGVHSLGVRSVGALGALSGGILIQGIGVAPVFFLGAALSGVATFVFVSIRTQTRARGLTADSIWRDALDGLRTMVRIPVVAALLTLALVVEIFAFSYSSLLPAVAKLVLSVGPAGLGALTLFAGFGAVAGSAAMSLLRGSTRRGPLILAVTAGYGLFLVAFAASSNFTVSLVLVAGIGAMAAVFDALQWVLLQGNMPVGMRGRAIGGWIWAIGFGWVGPIALGAAGEAVGVQWTIAGSGGIVVISAVGTALFVARLRRA